MNLTVANLTARSLLGRRRAVWLLALPAVLLLLSFLVRILVGHDDATTTTLLGGFALGTMLPLLGLIVGTGVIGPEIEDGSIVYLLSKPISRYRIVITKALVATVSLIAVTTVPIFAAGLALSGGSGRVATSYAVGGIAAGTAYCVLFLLLAVTTRNAVVIGLLYALIWETLIGGFVPGAQALSIQQWGLSLTGSLLGEQGVAMGVGSAMGAVPALTLLMAVIGGGTWYAGRRLRGLFLHSDA